MNAADGRFGDAFHELPRRCLIGWPEVVGVAYGYQPCRQYEGLIIDLLGRGNRVPDHPSACKDQVEDTVCGHARVWHRHRTRTHPCMVEGCGCLEYVKMLPVRRPEPDEVIR